MGYFHQKHVEQAGQFLLSQLATENPIRYSRFMDGTKQTENEMKGIAASFGLEPGSFLPHIDVAAAQLERQGIVKLQPLPDVMCDDTNDYQISLNSRRIPVFTGEDR